MLRGVATLVAPSDHLAHAEAAAHVVGIATAVVAAGFVALAAWYGYDGPLTEVLTDEPPFHFACALPARMAGPPQPCAQR